MKKRILSIAMASALAATMFAGCGAKQDEASSASSTSAAVESSASSEASEATEEASASSEASEATEETSASSESAEKPSRIEDTWMRENYKTLLGDESAEGKKVGFTLISLGNDFMLYLSQGIEEAMKAEGVTVQTDSCDGDPTTQQEQIENYVTMGMDLIMVFPVNGEACVTAAESAADSGIPVVAFAMDIPSDKITTHIISAEEADMGRACGEMASAWVDENLADKDEVKVLMIGSTSSPELATRSDEQEKAISANSKCKVTRIDTPDSNSVDEGRKVAENEFLANDYDVVVAVNQQTAIGVNSYITSPDGKDDISQFAIFCVDMTDEVAENLVKSKTNESALRGTISMGEIADTVDVVHSTLMPILTGGHAVTNVDGSCMTITADNM